MRTRPDMLMRFAGSCPLGKTWRCLRKPARRRQRFTVASRDGHVGTLPARERSTRRVVELAAADLGLRDHSVTQLDDASAPIVLWRPREAKKFRVT